MSPPKWSLAIGCDEGLWALVTQIKASRVGVGFKRVIEQKCKFCESVKANQFLKELFHLLWICSLGPILMNVFPGQFVLYFRLFNTVLIANKICRWLDLNSWSLVSEVTALPTKPQPLPMVQICLSLQVIAYNTAII